MYAHYNTGKAQHLLNQFFTNAVITQTHLSDIIVIDDNNIDTLCSTSIIDGLTNIVNRSHNR